MDFTKIKFTWQHFMFDIFWVLATAAVNSTASYGVTWCSLVHIFRFSEERIYSIFSTLILKIKYARFSPNVSIFLTHYKELHPKCRTINSLMWIASLEDNTMYVETKVWANIPTGTTCKLCVCFMIVIPAIQNNTSFLLLPYYLVQYSPLFKHRV